MKMTGEMVLAIGGLVYASGIDYNGLSYRTITNLATVSSYNLERDTWQGDLAQLNTARNEASACTLAGKVYVFGGQHGEVSINSIETIYEISLFSQSTARWQLIEMS